MADPTPIEINRLLAQSFVFKALDDEARAALAASSHVRVVKAGDQIFREGDPGHSMIAIAQGTIRISTLSPNAREIVLAELSAGAVFGEIALLDGCARSADAHALTNCTLVVLERRALLEAMQSRPALARSLIEVLCARIRRSDERMIEVGFLAIPVRLANALLRASAPSDPMRGTPRSKIALSQGDLANMIGSSRENVNRCLRSWQKDGVVGLKDGWILIPDRAALQRISEAN